MSGGSTRVCCLQARCHFCLAQRKRLDAGGCGEGVETREALEQPRWTLASVVLLPTEKLLLAGSGFSCFWSMWVLWIIILTRK